MKLKEDIYVRTLDKISKGLEMKENYLIGLANLVNGSMLGYEDKGNIEQYKKWIIDYVKSLENKDIVIIQDRNCMRYPVREK